MTTVIEKEGGSKTEDVDKVCESEDEKEEGDKVLLVGVREHWTKNLKFTLTNNYAHQSTPTSLFDGSPVPTSPTLFACQDLCSAVLPYPAISQPPDMADLGHEMAILQQETKGVGECSWN